MPEAELRRERWRRRGFKPQHSKHVGFVPILAAKPVAPTGRATVLVLAMGTLAASKVKDPKDDRPKGMHPIEYEALQAEKAKAATPGK